MFGHREWGVWAYLKVREGGELDSYDVWTLQDGMPVVIREASSEWRAQLLRDLRGPLGAALTEYADSNVQRIPFRSVEWILNKPLVQGLLADVLADQRRQRHPAAFAGEVTHTTEPIKYLPSSGAADAAPDSVLDAVATITRELVGAIRRVRTRKVVAERPVAQPIPTRPTDPHLMTEERLRALY
ncbi:hypothetical protein MOQ72_37375 [Saccharopolyspora sp. K220]|uniref:hypothetical protein n=1 Tax=Saccharopolyspora soli TaxID=2926618 RepID=UPI001F5A6286|nr:hypothetical protein [Saccharopolyspora soli]MCI2423105.1 hypothetical protein [Saccharopolyspora soli]